MEHFAIVQALCRIALSKGDPAAKRQVERLCQALAKTPDDARQLAALTALLQDGGKVADLAPSRVIRSEALSGEILSSATAAPVDRETAMPLAQIVHPPALPDEPPILDAKVRGAVDSVLHEWLNVGKLQDHGLEPATACLIYGPPGTGKTHLALWIARQLKVPVVLARLDGLISSFLGTTARNVGTLFAFAARYRCVLLLDEFDAIAKIRDDPQEVGEIKRVVNALLQNLDERRGHGFTIAITNHEQLLDDAIWRRFDVQVSLGRPNESSRLEITKHYISPMKISEDNLRLIAWLTDGLTGAEIRGLITTLKKSIALADGAESSFIELLRQYVARNSARLRPDRAEALLSEDRSLMSTLQRDLAFSKNDLAKLFHVGRATVYRWTSAGVEDGTAIA